MSGPVIGSLFSGYGGLDLGLRHIWPEARTAWVSDIESGPRKVLAHRYPGAPNLGDITAIDWSTVEPVDIITGGSPCQDLSHAGKRAGMRPGTRSGLWASMCDAIEIIRPSLVIWENVHGAYSAAADSDVEPCALCVGDEPGTVLRALGRVLGDLAEIGFDAEWTSVRASDVGACHRRARVFVLAWPADADRAGRDQWRYTAPREAEGGRALTDDSGCGGAPVNLPTPTVGDANASGSAAYAATDTHNVGTTLTDAVVRNLLPTPAVNDEASLRAYLSSKRGDACAEWSGWTNGAYGKLTTGRKKVFAHRLAYEIAVGPIPEGHEIDHLCQSPLCVNPDHLEAVTPAENRRRVTERRTHCKRGHEFTEANTYWVREGARACRECRARQDRIQKQRSRGIPDSEIVDLLPTPVTNDMGKAYTPDERDALVAAQKAKHGNGNGHGKPLEIEAARLLPTPQAHDKQGEKTPEQVEAMRARGFGVRNLNEVVANELTSGDGDGDSPEGATGQDVSGVRSDIQPEAIREAPRGRDALPEQGDLLAGVRECEVRDSGGLAPDASAQGEAPRGVRGVLDDGTPACASHRPGRDEQLAGEPGGAVRVMSPEASLAGGSHGEAGSDPCGCGAYGIYARAVHRWEGVLGRPAPRPTEPTGREGKARLSVHLTEFMMGLPAGWITDVPDVTRNEALRLCGNGVVPQQCEAAVRHLLEAREMAVTA